jgi:beta-lactamase class D
MKFIHVTLTLFVILILTFCIPVSSYAEDSDLAKLFQERGIKGTMIISSLDGKTSYIHNAVRSRERFIPASTFKILNTLIALEEGAIKNEKEIIKWDGKDKGFAAWNKDQSLETAFPSSCVWFYQELARRVGKGKYESYLRKMNYGNGETGPDVSAFWLEGNLKISAVEQIAFLKKVYNKEYAFRPSSYELLRRLMVVEKTPAYTIRAKTGWTQRVSPQVGWFVGYVESGDKVWFFTTNIEITKPEESRLRQEVTIEALKLRGII